MPRGDKLKVGDLVRNRFDGRWDEVGIVMKIVRATGVPDGMAEVLWNVEQSHRSDRLYRIRNLEIINEGR